jgi:hypothetical protein
MSRAALSPADLLGHHPQGVAALGELVCVRRVRDLIGLQEVKAEQLLHGRRGQRSVLLDGQRRQAVPRLRRDHDARPGRCDDVAEFLEHQRCAVQVDLQDRRRRRLRRRDAGRVDQAR